jgi:hypothetical protein
MTDETITQTGTIEGDSHAKVQAATLAAAGGVGVVSAATDAANAQAAPPDRIDQFIQAAEARLTKLENALFEISPQLQAVYDAIKTPVEAAEPVTIPVFAAIDAISGVVNGVIVALHKSFGPGKLALPDPLPTSAVNTTA